MLTSLDFLKIGEAWPPKSETNRLEMYHKNHEIFEGEHAEVYAESFKRIERIVGNFQDIISYPVILNFQKLMSLKMADLLMGEPPQYKSGDAGSAEQKSLDTIKENSDLNNTIYQDIIDVSRFGDGLLHIRKGTDGGIIDLTQPPIWFPVVDRDNVKEIVNHVLAWQYTEMDRDVERKYLKARIHYKGYYLETVYELVGGAIARLIESETRVNTGLSDFAIVQVSNVTTSDRITGLDDYTDVDSIISELMVRVGQVSRILDKHANPSMSGPASSLERDPISGEYKLKTGNYFPRDSKEDPDVAYITWDGQLAANFTQIEKLINLLYTISEMGSALFGDMSGTTGQVASGTALKRLMISPLSKVNRIRMRLDPALKKALSLCSELGGKNIVKLERSEISITWQDGVPNDETEQALIIEKRTAGKATMSQKSAMMKYDGLSEEDADEELAVIQDEEAGANPMTPAPFSGGTESTPPVIPEETNTEAT